MTLPADRVTTKNTEHPSIGRRVAVVVVAGVTLATVAACGSGSSGGAPTPTPDGTATTSASPTAAPVTVGATPILRSTLAKGTHDFVLGKDVTQTADGLMLSVGANQQVEAVNASSQGLTSSLEIGVMATPSTTPGLLYGIGCEGDFADFGDQYSGVTDAAGNWQILEQQGGKSTLLASGTATLATGDIQLNLACIELTDKPHTTRLSFALDGAIVGGVDHTDSKIATGNGYQLVLADPGTGNSGTAIFHHLDLRTATANG